MTPWAAIVLHAVMARFPRTKVNAREAFPDEPGSWMIFARVGVFQVSCYVPQEYATEISCSYVDCYEDTGSFRQDVEINQVQSLKSTLDCVHELLTGTAQSILDDLAD